MPPSKASTSKTRALKQSSLSFTSKRNTPASAKDGTKGKGTSGSTSRKSSTVPNTPRRASPVDPSTDDDVEADAWRTYQVVSDEEQSSGGEDERPTKRRKLVGSSGSARPVGVKERAADRGKGVFRSRESIENSEGGRTRKGDNAEGLPQLAVLEKSGRWRKHYGEVRAKMGNIEPIHAEGLTNVHHILRIFDLSYEYGPCIGVSRLERWERAAALGLDPPPEVKEILTTKEGVEKNDLKQCVFYGEV